MPKSASENRRLAIAAATNWAAFAVSLGVSFFLSPYMIRGLGDDRYGVWCVVESVLAYFTLFDLGIAACLVRFVARYDATGDRLELNKLVSSCLAVFTCAALGVLAAAGVLIPLFGPRLEQKIGSPGDVLPFLFVMAANLALTLPLSIFPSILDGLQRYPAKSGVRLGFLLVKVAGVIMVMETNPGLLPLACVFTVINLLEHAVLGLLVFRILPGLRFSVGLLDWATFREVRGYSVDAFLAMLAGRITVQTGAIIAGGSLTVAAAAHYAVAARIVELAKNLFRSVTTTLTPAVSEREARGDLAGVRVVFLTATRWVLYLVLPVNLGLVAFGRPFFARWIGNPLYGDWCFPAAAILSTTLSIGVAQSVASRILYGMGKLRLFARLALIEAGVNLVMSLVLVGEYGLVGVAIAVAAPNVAFCLFVIGYTRRVLSVSLVEYLLASWSRPAAAALVPALIWCFWPTVEATWGSIGIGIVGGMIPYILAVGALEFRRLRGLRWAVQEVEQVIEVVQPTVNRTRARRRARQAVRG